jgi:hypothetical protein
MVISLAQSVPLDAHPVNTDAALLDLTEVGWRQGLCIQPDGSVANVKIPLTEAEFLHPQLGYCLPNNTFHQQVTSQVKQMLQQRYANTPDVGVFERMLLEWDIPGFGNHAPDISVVCGVINKDKPRMIFNVLTEGVRPAFIMEIVSPQYRRSDRETKVIEYAQAKVQEYFIVDRRPYRGQQLDEVLGYRLVSGMYQPITPDEMGRVWSQTLGLGVSFLENQIVMEDA